MLMQNYLTIQIKNDARHNCKLITGKTKIILSMAQID